MAREFILTLDISDNKFWHNKDTVDWYSLITNIKQACDSQGVQFQLMLSLVTEQAISGQYIDATSIQRLQAAIEEFGGWITSYSPAWWSNWLCCFSSSSNRVDERTAYDVYFNMPLKNEVVGFGYLDQGSYEKICIRLKAKEDQTGCTPEFFTIEGENTEFFGDFIYVGFADKRSLPLNHIAQKRQVPKRYIFLVGSFDDEVVEQVNNADYPVFTIKDEGQRLAAITAAQSLIAQIPSDTDYESNSNSSSNASSHRVSPARSRRGSMERTHKKRPSYADGWYLSPPDPEHK